MPIKLDTLESLLELPRLKFKPKGAAIGRKLTKNINPITYTRAREKLQKGICFKGGDCMEFKSSA